jgi:hypothetical protein
VHLGAAFVADEQPFELVEVCEGPFDDPAGCAEPGAVRGAAAGDQRFDASLAEQPAVLVVVVAAIGDESVGPTAGPAGLAANRRDTIEQRNQLGDVVAVAAGHRPGQRDPRCVYEKVMLRTVSGSINRARARLGAPFFACR